MSLNSYIDENENIFVTHRQNFNGLSIGSDQLSVSLADIPELSGQSTWIINRVHYSAFIAVDIDTSITSNDGAYGNILLGVVPEDSTAVFDQVSDYQDVKGWPFMGTWKPWSIPKLNDNVLSPVVELYPLSKTSVSGTYRPKSTLALNRLQKIIFNVDSLSAPDVYGRLTLCIQAKRGK